MFTISFLKNLVIEEVLLYNAIGQSMKIRTEKIQNGEVKITVNHPAAGVYILSIKTKDGNILRSRLVME